jgi:GWxTD domain-containing protein
MILLLTFITISLALLPVAAQLPETIAGERLSELLQDWPDQYVRWIMTDGERKRYKALSTDEQRLGFIEEFWRRRDPTPETPQNEYRADYLQRFAYALRTFAAGKPGWATDRGRIYLLLGPPHSIQQNPMGRSQLERPSEIWTYNNLDIPKIPATLDIKFVDFKGTGDFEIVSDLDTSAPVDTIFGIAETPLHAWAMRRGKIGQVDPLTGADQFREVDSTRLTMAELDLQEQLREIHRPERTLQSLDEIVDAQVTFARISLQAATGAQHPNNGKVTIPVGLAAPYRELASRPEENKLVYDVDYLVRLVDDKGAEAARVEQHLVFSLTGQQHDASADHQLFIEEQLEAEPGTYKLLAVVRDNLQNKIGSLEHSLDVRAPASGGLSLGNLVLARALVPSTSSAASPFQFGSLRVVPSFDTTFQTDENVNLYLEAYGATTEADGKKRIKVDFFIMRHGRLFMGVPASHLFPTSEPAGISASIPLRKCTAGDYTLRVRVTDEVTGERAETESVFTVRESSTPTSR